MAISLADVKRGYKVKRKDEEDIINTPQISSASSGQTISLADIRSGKSSIKPIINDEIDTTSVKNEIKQKEEKKEKNISKKNETPKMTIYNPNNQQLGFQNGDKTLLKNDINHYKEPEKKKDTTKIEYKDGKVNRTKVPEENILSTINNGLVQMGKGIARGAESLVDTGLQIGSSKYNPFMYLLGDKDTVAQRQQIAQEMISDNATNRLMDKLGYNKKLSNGKTVQEQIDSDSFIKSDKFSGQLLEGVGNMLPSIMLGNMGAGEIGASALMGLNSYGSAIDEAYNEGANRKEANLYGLGSAAVETVTEYLTGGIPGVSKVSHIGLDNLAEAGLRKIPNRIVREAARIGYKAAGEGLEEGVTEIINPFLKNATYSEDEKIDWDQVKKAAAMGTATGLVLNGPADFYNMNQAIKEQINSKPNNVQKNVQNNVANEELSTPVPNNTVFNNNISNQTVELNLKQSAQNYNIDVNNETINSIDQTLSQRGIKAKFDSNAFINSNENAFWQLNEDGSREVIFNPNAKTNDLLENVAVHELYHDIANSKDGETLRTELLDFAKTKEGYEEARKSLEQLYSNKYDPNSDKFTKLIDEEAVASILGKKLGNQEFVSSLTVEKPSLAKNVYNWVVDKLNKLNKMTGYKSEKLFWKDVKNKFDSAYRSEFNKDNVDGLDNDMLFSKGKLTSGEDIVVSDDINGSRPSNKMAEKTLKKMLGITYVNNSNNNEIIISNKDIKKYLNDGYNNYRNAKLKKRIAGNYGEVIELAKINSSEPNKKNSKRGKQGYDYYDVNLAYPIKDSYGNVKDYKYYTARLVVRKDNNSNFAYDLDKFTEKKGAALDKTSLSITTGKPVSSSFSENNIPNSNQNVKSGISTKYSMQNGEINAQDVDIALETFRNYVSEHGFNETAKDLQRKYSKLLTEYNKQTSSENTTANTKNALSESVDDVVSDIERTMEQDVIDDQFIDELIYNSRYYKDNYIDIGEVDLDDLNMTEDQVDSHNRKLYDKILGEVEKQLQKEGISRRIDEANDRYVYDSQELAKKGYNELLDYLDNNNVNYEVSKSTQAGYVPSIYIKDANGDTIYRIANHDNGYVDDFDMVYNDAYNTLFSDKDYANWKENIIPKIEKEIGTLSNQNSKYSMQENQNNVLDNSNIQRYDDLSKTNYIEYFRKDNGDVRVNLMDSNNNLVNQLDLVTTTDAIKQFGERLGNQLYNYATDINQRIDVGNDINNLGLDTDYFMNHRPTQTGLTADDITNQNVETPMPKDMYDNPEYYFQMNEQSSKESMAVLRKIRGNPNAEITIYRATPGNKINSGDWITLSKSYAEWHNQSQFDGKANILQKKVKAKDVQFAGDDINEFGYFPNSKKYSQSDDKWNQYLDTNFKSNGKGTTLSQLKPNKVLNPSEIANLTPEDASTTPKLKNVKVEKGTGNSSFYNNLTEKSEMLTLDNRARLAGEEDIQFYKKVTNKDSLDKAYKRLNDGGMDETIDWIARNGYDENGKLKRKPTATDVAEGWILLKQYQDAKDYNSMVQVAKTMRQMGTEVGQAVQAYNIMSRLTPEGMVKYAQSELQDAYDNMIKNKTKKWIEKNRDKFELTPDETAYIIDNIKEASKLPDGYDKKVKLAQIQSLISNKLPPTRGAGTKAWMRISMLFNPKTQIRNILGNAVITPVNAISDVFSALVDKQVSKKTGVRTTGAPNVKNYAKGFKKGLYESYNDFKLDINTRDMQGNRFEIGEGKSFNNNTKLGKALNQTDHLLSFMLDAGDRPFYEATFTNSINNQKILNNTDVVTQDMIDIATTEALQRTWQDNNDYTKFVLETRKGLNKLFNVNGYGLGDVLIPFAKTPANLTKAIVDYSPVGIVNVITDGAKLKNAIETNQFTPKMQHKFVQDLGKATAGTMLYVLGYALAKANITTGESNEDKDVANFMKNTLGIQSYSIKIGDKSFTYDWAQPVAAPFSMMANLVNKSDDKEADTLNKALSTMDTGMNLIFQQSFLESIQNVLTNPKGITEGIVQQIADLPSRAVPTFVKQINDMIDPITRTSIEKDEPIETAKNKVKSKVPGLSKELAPTRDTLGREIKKYGGDNNIFNVFLNPANTSKGRVSESAKEIYKIYQETGDKNIMPRVAPYSIMSGGKSEKLDSKERSEFQKISGQMVEENVKKLAKTSKYKELDNSYKAEAIKSIVDYSYNYAKSKVLNQPISSNFKKAYEFTKNGGALYDFYADKIYKKSKEK